MSMDGLALDTAVRDRILRFHRARLQNPADADDLTQQTMMRIAARADTLRDDERAEAWMMRIAKNALIDFYRKRAREKETLTADGVVDDRRSIGDDDEDADDDALRVEMQSWIGPFIDTLDAPYAEALRLVELEGLTQKQAAEHVGISLSGMKSRVQRARQKLRAALHTCCAFEVDARGRPTDFHFRGDACACADDEPASSEANSIA